MESKRMTGLVLVLAVAFASVLGLAACSSAAGESGSVAATINGTKIMEDDVTTYITDFRKNSGLEDDEKWAEWMSASNMTPQEVREQVINYYKELEIVKLAAKEKGVTVDKSEVDDQVNTMKANYNDDEAWKSALASAGTTEEEYRKNVEASMLQAKLQEAIVDEANTGDATDDQVIEQLATYAPLFDGAKRSSHILFSTDDEAQAKEVLDKINSGELDFAEAAKQYSIDTASAENGGDVGWDRLNTFVSEYTTALNELDKDQVSDLVTSQYGLHIIKCTDVFKAPETIDSLDQVPEELTAYVRDLVSSNLKTSAYSDWIKEYSDNADFVINDMPEGLPYNVEPANGASSDASAEQAAADTQAESTEADEATEGSGAAEE